jgi:hypothetical protein
MTISYLDKLNPQQRRAVEHGGSGAAAAISSICRQTNRSRPHPGYACISSSSLIVLPAKGIFD